MRTFSDDEDRRAFLELVGGVVQEGGLIVHAFCVMPNHYHLTESRGGGAGGSGSGGGAQPALSALRRLAKAEEVEWLVSEHFAGEVPRRQRRVVLYALRKHSRMRPSEIARRCGRTPAAVSLAVRDLDREATENADLAKKLTELAKAIARSSSAERDYKS